MLLEEVELFSSKKDFFYFLFAAFFVLNYSLLIEFNNYKNLTRFDSALIDAQVLKQYSKTQSNKTYQVLKLKNERGFNFYTSAKKNFAPSIGKTLSLEIWTGEISFYDYMSGFYAYSKVLNTKQNISLKEQVNKHLDAVHPRPSASSIYKALYTATPLTKDLQEKFSQLGISHLLAISGFHLGVLATLLFFLFKLPYKFFQDRYFPYRSYKLDSFVFISLALLAYLLFLDAPPSLLRAFTMMLIGFFLYDRGYKIISMQTLLLTVIILLSFFPRLLFSLGFFLSIAGVFYIFLFLIYFKNYSKLLQFILLPFWVYLMMLPYSLVIFSSFSLYHPLSILWTSLFSLFYPLSIIVHLVGYGSVFDTSLDALLNLVQEIQLVHLEWYSLAVFIGLSLLAVYKKVLVYLLLLLSLSSLVYAVVEVT